MKGVPLRARAQLVLVMLLYIGWICYHLSQGANMKDGWRGHATMTSVYQLVAGFVCVLLFFVYHINARRGNMVPTRWRRSTTANNESVGSL